MRRPGILAVGWLGTITTSLGQGMLWHRGDRVSAHYLFDLSLVIERQPEALTAAAEFLVRHRAAFVSQLSQRAAVLPAQVEAIAPPRPQRTASHHGVDRNSRSASVAHTDASPVHSPGHTRRV